MTSPHFGDLLLAALIVWLVFTRATQDRTIEVKKLLMLPALSLYLLYSTIDAHFILNDADRIVLFVGFLLGCASSALLRKDARVLSDKVQQLICIPGGWSSIAMYAMILGIKVAVGYFMSQHPDAGREFDLTQSLLLLASSLAFGLPTGQALVYFVKYQRATHEALVLPRAQRAR